MSNIQNERINEIDKNNVSIMIIKGIESTLLIDDVVNRTSWKYENDTSVKYALSYIFDEIRDRNFYGFFETELKNFCYIDDSIPITDIIFNSYMDGKINVDSLKKSLNNILKKGGSV